ncbi:MAG TPA: PAS domain-containing protein, partial [Rhodobacteraceae bacterium]|nr:PAS domain-containing protein [Paracoccaceae bacterium]
MSPYNTPVFQTLRGKADPAWLWDFDRGRIVWANRAGIEFWSEATLFDLLDRRFEAGSATADAIGAIAEALQADETRDEEISRLIFFAEAGQLLKCKGKLHDLEDGRTGLLLFAERGTAKGVGATPELFEGAVRRLPVAMAVFDRGGKLVFANRACRDIFGDVDPETGTKTTPVFHLEKWLGGERPAHDFISRLQRVGYVSEARALHTRFGHR